MNWQSKTALIILKLLLPIALFSSGLLLVLIFPEEYMGHISMSSFSPNPYLLFFAVTIVFVAIFIFFFYVSAVAWVVIYRKFIGGDSTLQVIRNASKVKSPTRKVVEYIFRKIESGT